MATRKEKANQVAPALGAKIRFNRSREVGLLLIPAALRIPAGAVLTVRADNRAPVGLTSRTIGKTLAAECLDEGSAELLNQAPEGAEDSESK